MYKIMCSGYLFGLLLISGTAWGSQDSLSRQTRDSIRRAELGRLNDTTTWSDSTHRPAILFIGHLSARHTQDTLVGKLSGLGEFLPSSIRWGAPDSLDQAHSHGHST